MFPNLKFHEDHTFKIVQLTDVHWCNGEEADLRTEALMERVLREEKPDLVVFTGDVIDSKHCVDPLESFRRAVAAVDRSQIPWAAVFGNHDSEGSATRETLMELMAAYPLCLSEPGPEAVSGVGNYVLPIQGSLDSERIAAQLYFMDSGSYAPEPPGGYAWIERDQIKWYTERSAASRTNRHSDPLPSLAFFHIPLPEYKEVWELADCIGSKHENVCSPMVNSGFFSALVEMGDVIGTFVGHDHLNDYIGELHGIRLGYGRATGYNTYGKEGFPRGARVIRLFEGERRFDTWIRLDEGQSVL